MYYQPVYFPRVLVLVLVLFSKPHVPAPPDLRCAITVGRRCRDLCCMSPPVLDDIRRAFVPVAGVRSPGRTSNAPTVAHEVAAISHPLHWWSAR
jgi:hypothetical protein